MTKTIVYIDARTFLAEKQADSDRWRRTLLVFKFPIVETVIEFTLQIGGKLQPGAA